MAVRMAPVILPSWWLCFHILLPLGIGRWLVLTCKANGMLWKWQCVTSEDMAWGPCGFLPCSLFDLLLCGKSAVMSWGHVMPSVESQVKRNWNPEVSPAVPSDSSSPGQHLTTASQSPSAKTAHQHAGSFQTKTTPKPNNIYLLLF